MRLRWSAQARRQLAEIHHYIAQDKPDAAHATVEGILEAAERLRSYPAIGRAGRVAGTRELIHSPFVIVYALHNDWIDIRSVLHGRQRP
jgi:toxin ParE1/3/4